jgi:hypothetical protein
MDPIDLEWHSSTKSTGIKQREAVEEILTRRPQYEAGISAAVMVHYPAGPKFPVNWFIADEEIVKSGLLTSMARILMILDTPWLFVRLRLQQDPQSELLKLVTAARRRCGKVGRELNVVNSRVRRPFNSS